MQCPEVSAAVRPIYGSLGVKRLGSLILSTVSHRECSLIESHRSAFDHCDLFSSKESCSVHKTCSVPAVGTGRAGFDGEVAAKL